MAHSNYVHKHAEEAGEVRGKERGGYGPAFQDMTHKACGHCSHPGGPSPPCLPPINPWRRKIELGKPLLSIYSRPGTGGSMGVLTLSGKALFANIQDRKLLELKQ